MSSFSLFGLVRQILGSLCQVLLQPVRRWTKPDNHAPIPNAALDVTRSKSELILAQEIWACNFVHTHDLFFRAVFVLVIIELGSRRLLHFGVTRESCRSGRCAHRDADVPSESRIFRSTCERPRRLRSWCPSAIRVVWRPTYRSAPQ